MKPRPIGWVLAGLVFVGSEARAQEAIPPPAPPVPPAAAPTPTPPSKETVVATRRQIISELVTAGLAASKVPAIREPFGSRVTGFQGHLASYLMTLRYEKATYKALLEAMDARVDKQVGAPASSGGGTSLVSKGAVPMILGAAVESGALEKSIDGKVVTFRAKPLGLAKLGRSRGVLDMYADYSKNASEKLANRFSASVSFDTSRGASAGALTADKGQFSGWSVRAELVDQRDGALSQYGEKWRELLTTGGPYVNAAAGLRDALEKWPFFTSWRDALHAEVVAEVDVPFKAKPDPAAAAVRFRALLDKHFAKLDQAPAPPAEVAAAVDAYVVQLTLVQKGIGDVEAFVKKGALLTVEFATARDEKLPDLYTATGVFETGLGGARKSDLTLNADASFYRAVPTTATRKLKNVAFSAELSHPVASLLGLRSTTLTLAARYSYLPKDSVTPGAGDGASASGGSSAAPKGSIVSFQAKLTLPVKGSGIKAPLSITFANRTEAIKEKVVRANFGVTFDLDTLLAAGKAAN